MTSTFTVTAPASSRLLATPARVIADLGLSEYITDGELTEPQVERLIAGASASISAYFNQRRDQDGNVTIARETIAETWRRESWARGSCRAAPLILGRSPVASVTSVTEDGVVYKRRIGAGDGAMSHDGANPTYLTSAAGPEGAPFAAAMAGQAITVPGAGAGGADLTTTVASVIDDETVALASPALTTVADAAYALDNPAYAYDVAAAAGMIWKLDAAGYRTAFTASVVTIDYLGGWTVPDPDDEDAAYTLPLDVEDSCVIFVRRKLEQLRPDDMVRVESESFPGIGTWKFALQQIDWSGGMPSDVIEMLKPYRRLHV